MKKILFLIVFIPLFGHAGDTRYRHKDTFVQQEFEFVGKDIDFVRNSSLSLSSASATYLNKNGPYISVSTSGEVTEKFQPSFLAMNTATDANVTGDDTLYTVIFDSEIIDKSSDYNNSTGIFIAPITGLYLLSASVYLTGFDSTHEYGSIWLVTSNGTYWGDYILLVSNTLQGQIAQVTAVADMDAGDIAYIGAEAGTGNKVVDVYGSATYRATYFSGTLLN